MNSGYYYQCVDTSLDYTLVTDIADNALFSKKEDVERVAAFYKASPAHWWSHRTGEKLDAATEAVDMEAFKKQEKSILPYDDSESTYMGDVKPAFRGLDRRGPLAVFAFADGVVDPGIDDLFFINHRVGDVLGQTKADAHPLARLDEGRHRSRIKSVLSVDEFRM